MATESFMCSTYKCTVTPSFCENRRKKDDIYCLPCNTKDVMIRKMQKLAVRQKSNQHTYFRKICAMLIPLEIGETKVVDISDRGIKRQQSTICNAGIELGRKYRTSNSKNGTVFIVRIK